MSRDRQNVPGKFLLGMMRIMHACPVANICVGRENGPRPDERLTQLNDRSGSSQSPLPLEAYEAMVADLWSGRRG
jgi:hypothetical protein